jgi:hypothetical protein
MPERHAHLVGSLPGADPREAMSQALDILGPHLLSLPDGETGERRNWIISIIESMREHPDLEVARKGDWSDYDKVPKLRIRKGRKLYGANLDFGHVAAVKESWPVFTQLRDSAGLPELVFQAGVPGDFDLAMFTLGPVAAMRNRSPFTEATLNEIHGVSAITGGDVVFQIEVPVELVMVARAPAAGRAAAATLAAKTVTGLAAAAPAGSRFGVHLCLGDMNNRALGRMTDVGPLVALSNAIVKGWPSSHALEFVHAPFSAADHPAPTDSAFYRPLANLVIPRGTRFAAGFAHEAQSISDQLRVRDLIDDGVGRAVDIASACGLGRRSFTDGRTVLERTAELCTA